MSAPLIIAIDGPAASGKGTLARRLATRFGLPHLDTGLTFRAVAHAMLAQDLPQSDEGAAVEAAKALDLGTLDRNILSAHAIGEAASQIAVYPPLRSALLELQRGFAQSGSGAVLDGRDIGTVVCPDATVKLFVTASPEARAKRRYLEAVGKGQTISLEQILADIHRRDARDSDRSAAPLVKAADAHLIDTTEMDIDTAFQTAETLVLDASALH